MTPSKIDHAAAKAIAREEWAYYERAGKGHCCTCPSNTDLGANGRGCCVISFHDCPRVRELDPEAPA